MSDIFERIVHNDETGVREILAKNPAAAHAVNGDGISALMWALYHHHRPLAEIIAAEGIELTVWEAAAFGDLRTLERILELQQQKANDIGPDGFLPIHLASYFGHHACLRLLLRNGADANAVAANHARVRPLHSAVTGRHLECVGILLEAGADPNVRQAGGFTPLHSAVEHGDGAIYESLITAGADATTADDGRTAARKSPA